MEPSGTAEYECLDRGDHTLRLLEKALDKDDPGPKALACYGLLVRGDASGTELVDKVWLRFVNGNPNSTLTIQFLVWCCEKLQCA